MRHFPRKIPTFAGGMGDVATCMYRRDCRVKAHSHRQTKDIVEMENNENTFGNQIQEHLLEVCTSQGLLKGALLESPDIDETWERLASSYYGDAIKEFNAYPEFSLGCAGYLGMAVAKLWDEDWERYSALPYSFFQGERGFDDMDDHILDNILSDKDFHVQAMQSCSAAAYNFMMKSGVEHGTAEAYRMVLEAMSAMFKTGAAIELCRLGYKYEKVSI